MKIFIGMYKVKSVFDSDAFQMNELLGSICEYLELPDGDIEITLTNDTEIRHLNRAYRQKDLPTNVLSFPHYIWKAPKQIQDRSGNSFDSAQRLLWGEVILSVDTIRQDAIEQQVNFTDELIRICIHGMLHLFGYSHESEQDFEIMAALEESAINYYKKWIQHH